MDVLIVFLLLAGIAGAAWGGVHYGYRYIDRVLGCGDDGSLQKAWTVDRDGRVRTDKDRPVVLRASK